MERILIHSAERASDEAVRLWALASSQFPKRHTLILGAAETAIIEVISSFALNARRAMETIPVAEKFMLSQPRWTWAPDAGSEIVTDLRDALNRIIHAQKLEIRFVELPPALTVVEGVQLSCPSFRQRQTEGNLRASIHSHWLTPICTGYFQD